jgi:heterodisulfide reductase subunit A
MPKDIIGSVLVVGGGITGMQSALDLADSGFYVHLVEKSPAIGGLTETGRGRPAYQYRASHHI